VIGAIRVRGRWVSLDLLERLSRRSQGPTPPPRPQLVEEFCRATDWRDAKGRLSLSSARVALRRLEALGRVQLPPMGCRTQSARPRGLPDDGQPLPELPKVSARCRPTNLRLRLVQNEHDPAHRIWNRLMVREHPLGRRPLVGAQLRYLIECDQGILGAFGFGPPAYHLECRDQWIGWSDAQRRRQLAQVVNNSRFLILPWVQVKNLASTALALSTRRLATEWHDQYGVEPLLVETLVEPARFAGTCYRAANWVALGMTTGRGRMDRTHQRHGAAPKAVWVYPLASDAVVRLRGGRYGHCGRRV